MHGLYENEDIVIFWNSEKCYHAKRCVTGSPKTFDIQRKPWIDMSLAPNPEIWQTVEKNKNTCEATCSYAVKVLGE